MATEDQSIPDTRERGEGQSYLIGDRYRILTGSRLPELDMAGAEAYAVHDTKQPDEAVFARVCAPVALPRVEMMASLKHMKDAAILRPLDWGPVRIAGSTRPRLAVVFERPEHDVLMRDESAEIKPFATEHITRHILAPTVLTLG